MHTVYKISNIKNGKIYIGCTSKSIEQRWEQHISDCKKRPTHPLYADILNFGKGVFEITSIKTTKSHIKAFEYEKLLILKYNSVYPRGYNIKSVSTRIRKTTRLGGKFYKHIKEKGIKMSFLARRLELSNGYFHNMLTGGNGCVLTDSYRIKLNEILQTNY